MRNAAQSRVLGPNRPQLSSIAWWHYRDAPASGTPQWIDLRLGVNRLVIDIRGGKATSVIGMDSANHVRSRSKLRHFMYWRALLLAIVIKFGLWAGQNARAQAPSSLALVPISQVVQARAVSDTNEWSRVQGSVTLAHPGGSVFLQDATGGLFVLAATNSSIVVGDVIEAIGRQTWEGYSTTLRDGTYRSLGRRQIVQPAIVSGEQLQSGQFDMILVRVTGRLVSRPFVQGQTQVLHLDSNNAVVRLELSDVEDSSALSQLQTGSVLEATGVCSVGGTRGHRPTSFRLHLRSSSDIAVIAPPPWWTPQRMAVTAGTTLLGALVCLGWVWTLRREVRRKTDQISDRLRREAALEEKYRRIVDTALEGIVLLDKQGQIIFANRFMADMLGYAPAQVIGKRICQFVHADSRSEAEGFFTSAEFSSNTPPQDVLLQHRNGSELWVLAAKNSFTGENGSPPGVLVMLTNISERKRGEERTHQLNEMLERRVRERTAELESVNRDLETFSYSVSHDLRAPLRAIAGFSEALLEDHSSDLKDEAQLYLSRIRAAALDMNRLIEGLLSLARVTRNELRREEIDLSALAHTVVEEFREADPSHKVEVVIQPGLVDSADRALIRIVFSNLLQNAWKFSSKSPNPHVEVGKMTHGDEKIYFVRDNGAGFDPSHAGKLFKVFQRLHNPSEFEGSGIGLATVQKIIQRHGGRIWAEGKLGVGATFYFTLQAAPQSISSAAAG